VAEVNCCNVKAPRTRLLLGLLAIGMIAGGPGRAFGQQSLQVVPSPFINNSNLSGTVAIADNDIWAVGSIGNTASNVVTLAEHFNGSGWSVVSTPLVKGSLFASVAAAAGNDVWAVGLQNDGSNGNAKPLIEHWNGTNWSVVSGAKVPKGSFLTGVAAVASNDVWAVGNQPVSGSTGFDSFIEHWNGTNWSVVSSPQFAGGSFLGRVAGDSANDVWAVGQGNAEGLVEHWNGQTWSIVPSPPLAGNPNNAGTGKLDALTVLSPTNAWAVGSQPGPPPTDIQGVIEHWNGTSWSIVASAQANIILRGIAAVSADNIWAVSGGTTEHWDGTSWSLLATPNGVSLTGVTALSDGIVVAVGVGSNNSAVILQN